MDHLVRTNYSRAAMANKRATHASPILLSIRLYRAKLVLFGIAQIKLIPPTM